MILGFALLALVAFWLVENAVHNFNQFILVTLNGITNGSIYALVAIGYTLVQALEAAGKNLTRQDLVNAVNTMGASWKGPGLVPYRYSKTNHGGYAGVQMGRVVGGKIVLFGQPQTTDPATGSAITPYTTVSPPASLAKAALG